MRKKSIYDYINIILLQGLYLAIATFGIKSLVATAEQTTARSRFANENILNNQSNRHQTIEKLNHASKVNKVNQKYPEKLPLGKVWVVSEEKEVEPKSFNWVVNDTKKAAQQPFLELDKQQNKQETKPSTTAKPAAKDSLKNFDTVIKDTDISKGLFTIYRDKEKNKIYLEVQPTQLNKNYLATATLESGIGEAGIYSGMPLQDFLFYFERVNNNLNFVVRNVNFRTQEGDPQSRSLARSFSDSVLYRVKIQSIHPQRKSILIDLGDLLLADLAGLSGSLGVPGTQDESYFGSAKVFPENMEIQSILNFSGGSSKTKNPRFRTLADKRGFTLKLHYSLSQLPDNNYRPRLADERVGYFITAYQDLSSKDPRDSFVRYVNRWNLAKKYPNATISEPKQPIVYWIDNATPYEYREAIKEGVLMWNRAFETAGFKNAIEVKQMPDSATWDPSDIRYNTIRWINTVDGYFAMGPSRVNPLTGEILDADILIDASLVTSLKKDYQQIVQPTQSENRTSLSAMMQNRLLCKNSLNVEDSDSQQLGEIEGFVERLSQLAGKYDLCYGIEATNQFGYGKLALSLLRDLPPTSQQTKDYIHQYLRLIVAHEVGHTLGLRHNFRGSTMLSPKEMNDRSITSIRGQVSSVMDYIPPNIAPEGVKQGDYFPSIIGPYDAWAIKYGYAEFKATSTTAEKPFLDKIAAESDKPEYSYSTDEDVYDLDPTADAWDNSSNVLLYSKWQMDNARQMWDRINKRYPLEGESYSDVRDRFGAVLSNYFQQIYYTSKYIGGQSFYRVYASKEQNRLPFEPVALEKQRQALEVLENYIFAADAFNFSPELLNKLAPSRWRHWGSNPQVGRLDYPIHDLVLFMQNMVLSDLLSSDRLSRLKDIELKSEKGEALSLPELFNTLQDSIWTEVLKSKEKDLEISSLRRGLQRKYLDILTNMVLRKVSAPDDARTLAWYKLRQLGEKLEEVDSKDEYTKAHLLETRQRINKVLDAPLQTN